MRKTKNCSWFFFFLFLSLKSLRRTFNWLWNSLNLKLMHHSLHHKWDYQWGDWRFKSCHSQRLWPVRSVSRNSTKRFTAHRPEETICCSRAWAIHCSHFYHLWSEAGGYVSSGNFSILCLWLNCCRANIVMFLSLFWKKNAYTRQDRYNRKQYRFHPHAALQLTQKSKLIGALNPNIQQLVPTEQCDRTRVLI